jgi:hypothetical protein
MEQLFGLVSGQLQDHPETRKRQLNIRTYKVRGWRPVRARVLKQAACRLRIVQQFGDLSFWTRLLDLRVSAPAQNKLGFKRQKYRKCSVFNSYH